MTRRFIPVEEVATGMAARLAERCSSALDQMLGDFWPASPGDRTGGP